jgi:hypothetical protein
MTNLYSENDAMISFQTWLSQIIGYCQFIVDELGIRKSWVDGDFSQTSVTGFDELYEQVFDDLDSDACEKMMISNLSEFPLKADAVSRFLSEMRRINLIIESNEGLQSPDVLLSSSEWRRVVVSAEMVLSVFGENGVESGSAL